MVNWDKNKIRFYNSPFGWMKKQVRKNIYALENFCFLNMSNGLGKVNPEDFINLPETIKELEMQNL